MMTHDNTSNPYRHQMDDKIGITLDEFVKLIEEATLEGYRLGRCAGEQVHMYGGDSYAIQRHAANQLNLEHDEEYTDKMDRIKDNRKTARGRWKGEGNWSDSVTRK